MCQHIRELQTAKNSPVFGPPCIYTLFRHACSVVYFTFCIIVLLTVFHSIACTPVTCFLYRLAQLLRLHMYTLYYSDKSHKYSNKSRYMYLSCSGFVIFSQHRKTAQHMTPGVSTLLCSVLTKVHDCEVHGMALVHIVNSDLKDVVRWYVK